MTDYISKTDALLLIGDEEPLVWEEDDDYGMGRHNQWEYDNAAIESMLTIEETKLNPTLKDALNYIDNCDEDHWQEFVGCMECRGWNLVWRTENGNTSNG